jgi:anti-sigma regulatory factor (Ser/Thr protein kinase)
MRAGLRADAVEPMEVAVGEVLSNAHRHAYDGAVGPVSVAVFRHSNLGSVVITDGGETTEAPEVPRRLPPLTREGGRGLYLVSRLVDEDGPCQTISFGAPTIG